MKPEVKQRIEVDLVLINKEVSKNLSDENESIRQFGQQIISEKYNRLYLIIFLLAKYATEQTKPSCQYLPLAAVIDYINVAQHLHDKVANKNNAKSINDQRLKVSASILIGDFFYSRAFNMMTQFDQIEIVKVLSTAINQYSEGRLLQENHLLNPNVLENDFLQATPKCSSVLFKSVTELGAIVNFQENVLKSSLANFGQHFGTALSLTHEDWRNVKVTADKVPVSYLHSSKISLPIIRALEVGSKEVCSAIHAAIKKNDNTSFEQLSGLIEQTDGIEYTQNIVNNEIKLARQSLEQLPNTPYRSALFDLTYLLM